MRINPRVSILSLHFPPEPTGNAPYTGALASGLRERGMLVRALTAHPHYPEWRFRPGTGQWTHREDLDGVSVARFRHYLPSIPQGINRLVSESSFGARLLFARWGRPDAVILVSPALFSTAFAMVRARLGFRRPPVIVWVQDLYTLGITETGSGSAIVARAMRWVESRTLRSATKVVVIHSRFASFAIEQLGVDPTRIEVVRNWTHLASVPEASVEKVRNLHKWKEGETVVLHAGNMGAKQGLENVIAAARLADAQGLPLRFVLLGDGNQRAALELAAVGIERIEFLDSLGDESFQHALMAADVLLVNEKVGVSEMSVPSKLTSYFNSGRPVIAATEPVGVTASEIEASSGGLVVHSGNPQALLDACMQLRNDPRAAAELGLNGQRYRTSILAETAAIDRYAELIERIIAPKATDTRSEPLIGSGTL